MFILKELPYGYDALEPVIGKETMICHHDKHHNAYVTNLNNLIKGTDFENSTLEEILKNLDKMPENKRNGIRNNAGGVYNHNLFFEIMTPGGSKEPIGNLKKAIDSKFGNFEEMKKEFNAKGLSQFGSGWVFLVLDENNNLEIISMPNQDNPISLNKKVILGNDVWEHAYYLNYQNRRADYLENWWNLVNFDIVEDIYNSAI